MPEPDTREPDTRAPGDGPDPGVHHLFDRQFKRLLAMSGPATVALVNGLFGLDLPLDSPVTTLSGEHIDPGLARTDLDLILRVAGETVHFEGQSRYDRDIAVRVFAYEWGKAARTRHGDATHVTFARGMVVYLGPVRAPLEERLVLHFPDDPPATFTLRAVRVSDHTAAELASQGLFALIPFVILRERRKADEGSPGRRASLAPQVAGLVEQCLAAALAARDGGRLTDEDVTEIIAAIDRLFTHVYGKYPEFKEVDTLETLMKSRIDIAAEQAREQERERLKSRIDIAAEQAREQERERLKSRIDIAAEQALERGLEQGLERGQGLERERSIRHALSRGLEPHEVASLLGVTLDDVARAAA